MIHLGMPETEHNLRPTLVVVGVGGAGGNAVNNMIKAGLTGVEYLVANTDSQALALNAAPRKLQLGVNLTRGLGAGARPDVGRAAAEEQMAEIQNYLEGANMVFIAAGMGGGTGTGAAPMIAKAAREQGILTVGVVTKPFAFEGAHRMRLAESGISELQQYVDTLIIIPNQNLFHLASPKTTFKEAFSMADDVLLSGVRGVTDLITTPGQINLDFADIRTVMAEMGKAMMGTGEMMGEDRAVKAAEAAINNPLLDNVSMRGAKGVLINITGGLDMTLFEVDAAASRIRDEVDPDANIIFGSAFAEDMEGKIRVSIVATGIEAAVASGAKPRLGVVSGGAKANAPVPAYAQVPPTTPAFVAPQGHAVQAQNTQAHNSQANVQASVQANTHTGTAATGFAQNAASGLGQTGMGQTGMGQTAMSSFGAPTSPGFSSSFNYAAASAAATAMPMPMATPEMSIEKELPLPSEVIPELAQSRASITEKAMPTQQPSLFAPIAPTTAAAAPASTPTVPVSNGFSAPITQPSVTEPSAAKEAVAVTARRGPSLFERVTGLGGLGRKAEKPAEVKTEVKTEGSSAFGALASDPTERVKVSKADEDALDIPAFLRRQQN